jgi:hypothetical protein
VSAPDVANSDAGPDSAMEPVRQTPCMWTGNQTSETRKRPADRSKPVVAVLNDRWRVIEGAIEWILQKRKGRPTPKSTGWRARRYAQTRASLLDGIERLCGPVDPAALPVLRVLPEEHPSLTGHRAPSPAKRGRRTGR